MPLDSTLIGAIHLERLRRADARLDLGALHVVFQASTIDALLDGAYEGDVTFAELAEHGDLGLGTVQQLDGEMIALDGRFYRADATCSIHELDSDARTPFAVVVPFSPEVDVTLDAALGFDELARLIDDCAQAAKPCVAIRLDGLFSRLRLRSVHRQEPPYRPLAEALADQTEFELENAVGTLVGFRFPDAAQGLEVAGLHAHFLTADRRRGGHVLDLRVKHGRLRLDGSSDLHLEVPSGVALPEPGSSVGRRALVDRLERGSSEPTS